MGTCDGCGKELISSGRGRPQSRFCSPKCKDKITAREKRAVKVAERGERRCPVCDNVIPDTVTLKAVCCSRECGVKHQNRARADAKRAAKIRDRKPCGGCGGPIPEERTAQAKFCSWECKHAAMGARWRAKSPGYMRSYNYNLTEEQYVGMLAAQGDACAICKDPEWPGGRKSGSPHVDHDHTTGEVRGLLCGRCNTGIGQLGDDPARLRAAADYLER